MILISGILLSLAILLDLNIFILSLGTACIESALIHLRDKARLKDYQWIFSKIFFKRFKANHKKMQKISKK